MKVSRLRIYFRRGGFYFLVGSSLFSSICLRIRFSYLILFGGVAIVLKLENKGLVLENVVFLGGSFLLFGRVVLVLKYMLENKVFVLDFFCGVAIVLKHMLGNKGLVLENIRGGRGVQKKWWGLVLKHMLENKVFVLDFFGGVAIVLKNENKGRVLENIFFREEIFFNGGVLFSSIRIRVSCF